jgi:hypothetical protein
MLTRSELAKASFRQLREEIREEIKSQFQDRPFNLPDFGEGDVEVKVNKVIKCF